MKIIVDQAAIRKAERRAFIKEMIALSLMGALIGSVIVYAILDTI